MPIDPRIPMMTRVPRLGDRFSNFANEQNDLTRLARLDSANAEQQQFQRQRVIRNDDLNQQLTEQQIQTGKLKIEQMGKTQSAIDSAQDSVRMLSIAQSDPNQLLPFLEQRRQKLQFAAQSDPSINTVQTDQRIQALKSGNVQDVVKGLQGEVSLAQRLGYVPKDAGFTLKPSETRFDASGNPVASVAPKPEKASSEIGKIMADLTAGRITTEQARGGIARALGLKSPAEIAQIMQIERFKQTITNSDPKRRLELQALSQSIESGKLKVKETKEKNRKAGALKTTTLRLVKELLKEKNSIRALVGPYDNSIFSPTYFTKTVKVRTKIKQLLSILTAENMKLMTGVLSESDLKVIAAIAGGGLDLGGDDNAFIDELERMEEALMNEGVVSIGQTQTLGNGVTVTRID